MQHDPLGLFPGAEAVTLRLTPDVLAAAYDFLRTTDPFRRMKLPEADDIGFHVVSDQDIFADFVVENGVPIIRVSAANNGHTVTLLAAIAHEMKHLHQHMTGDRETHGHRFKRFAARCCAIHGFDPLAF